MVARILRRILVTLYKNVNYTIIIYIIDKNVNESTTVCSLRSLRSQLHVTTFTDNYGESCVRASESCFLLVLLVRTFTRSPPTRIALVVDTKFIGSSKKIFLKWRLETLMVDTS